MTPPERAALAGRLALLLDKQGDAEGTLSWLRVCLEGDAEGAVAVAAWRRFVEIAARRGTPPRRRRRWWPGPTTRARARASAPGLPTWWRRRRSSASGWRLPQRRGGPARAGGRLDPLNERGLHQPREHRGAARRLAAGGRGPRAPGGGRAHERTEAPVQAPGRGPGQSARTAPPTPSEACRRLLDLDPEDAEALLCGAATCGPRATRTRAPATIERLARAARRQAPADPAEAHLRLGQWAGGGPARRRGPPRGGAGRRARGRRAGPGAGRGAGGVRERRRAGSSGWPSGRRPPPRRRRGRSHATRAGVLERVGRSGEAARSTEGCSTRGRTTCRCCSGWRDLPCARGAPVELVRGARAPVGAGRRDPARELDAEASGSSWRRLVQEHAPARAESILRAIAGARAPRGPARGPVRAAAGARGADEEADALLPAAARRNRPASARRLAERARRRLEAGRARGRDGGLRAASPGGPGRAGPRDVTLRAELAEQRGDVAEAVGDGAGLARRRRRRCAGAGRVADALAAAPRFRPTGGGLAAPSYLAR